MTSKDLFINKENLIKSETPDQNSIKIHSIKGLSDPKKKMNINMTPKNSSIQV